MFCLAKTITVISLMTLLVLTGCLGGDSDNNNDPREGPLAGVWVGSVDGVLHTITISGPGNEYRAKWETSNKCFTSENGVAVHIDDSVGINCSGYNRERDRYTYPDIAGKYDGANSITSDHLFNPVCHDERRRITLIR